MEIEMSERNPPKRARQQTVRYDVGITPVIVVTTVNGALYSADLSFEDGVTFVGDPVSGKVIDGIELDTVLEGGELDIDGLRMSESARVAQKILDDPSFQRDLRRAVNESLARCS